jgi:hypothetical protein
MNSFILAGVGIFPLKSGCRVFHVKSVVVFFMSVGNLENLMYICI